MSIGSLTSLACRDPAVAESYQPSSCSRNVQQRSQAKTDVDLLISRKRTFKIFFLQLLPHSLGQELSCPGVETKRKRKLSSIWKTESNCFVSTKVKARLAINYSEGSMERRL